MLETSLNTIKPSFMPKHFRISEALEDQLSTLPGLQRCIQGDGDLLLIINEVPKLRVPEREPLFFWRDTHGTWFQGNGEGLSDLSNLLDRYAKTIDGYEAIMDEVDEASEIFNVVRHAAPLARATRNLASALDQASILDSECQEMRLLRDRAHELERAAELLQSDARLTLEFWSLEQSEIHAEAAEKLNNIANRLNLMAAFFLPLVALGGLLGMNIQLPEFLSNAFWIIFVGGLVIGLTILFLVGRSIKN